MHHDDDAVAGVFAHTHRIERLLTTFYTRDYLAFEKSGDRVVVIRVLPKTNSAGANFRFMRNAPLLVRLDHPGIRRTISFGAEDGVHYLIVEQVQGETLDERLRREHTLPVATALAFTAQLADALSAAHDVNIVHRDVNPNLVTISADARVKVDFDMPVAVDAGEFFVGNPMWLAPEVLSGEQVLPAADIHSLGALLFYMLTGKPPFARASTPEVFTAVLQGARTAPSTLRAVPASVDAIVLKAMAITPKDRFSSAREFAEAVRAVRV